MTHKIISFIFVILLAIGISAPNNIKNMPFDVNEVFGQVNHRQQVKSRIPNSEIQPFDQGEFLIDTTFVCGPSLEEQNAPVVAFDGTNYLVVWVDSRNGASDIYGSRISPSGVILDSANIAISTANGIQESLKVVFGDSNYLVVWDDYRNGNLDIYGARVSPSGIVLDPNGIPISTAPYGQYYHQVGFSGSNYLIVWEDGRNGIPGEWDVYCTRLSLDGVVLDPAGIPISTANAGQMSPQVAFDGTNYFIVWYDGRASLNDNVYGARLTTDGVVLDPNGFLISTAPDYQRYPQVIFGSDVYLVVWSDNRNDNLDIYGARVRPRAGSVVDPTGIPISTSPYGQYYHQVAFSGSNYLIVWEDGRNGVPGEWDIYGARLSTEGVVLDPNGIPISNANLGQMIPQVAFDGSNYFIVWQDARSGIDDDIYGAQMNTSGLVINSFPISIQEGNQESPTLFCGPNNQTLITYSGWTGIVQGRTYNAMRIWGKFSSYIGIDEENLKDKLLEVYPNPAKSVMRVRYPWTVEKQTYIKIFDVSGTLVKEEKVTSAQSHKQEMKISLKGINPGIYFLRLGKETKKFLVVK